MIIEECGRTICSQIICKFRFFTFILKENKSSFVALVVATKYFIDSCFLFVALFFSSFKTRTRPFPPLFPSQTFQSIGR